MFTVEHEWDHTKVTIMDETGDYEDMIVSVEDEGVYISQWMELLNDYHTIYVTHNMFLNFKTALDSTEGMFILR